MTKTFQMTSSMRIGTTMLTALLRAGLPLGPLVLLSVRGRKSGKMYTTPVALVERDHTRWLVAVFGEVNWVHNLRAAGQAQLTHGRRTEAIGVIELVARDAAPILKQFLTSYQMVPFLPPYFDVTPQSPLADFEREAAQHPVFRIERSEQDEGQRGSTMKRIHVGGLQDRTQARDHPAWAGADPSFRGSCPSLRL